MKTVLTVPRIRCEGSAATIEEALAAVDGVRAPRVDVVDKDVRVDRAPDGVGEPGLRRALAGAGSPAA